ncbi:MAG: 16S rRNA (guanine(527)-N(7))-methyltransferase RsmG [Lentisphaeria bacterium]|nr:16S rRNA (guanine(527)-N(7))-methyltransferase RsmG [Lentisphaeria bacterium]
MAVVLSEAAAGYGVADPGRFAELCGRFFELLTAANARMNLTRITTREEFEVKHVIDSLAIARVFPELASSPLRVADIGCGAGFPSVVLAAAFPQLRIAAIDSTHKKIDFVTLAARELGLDNLSPVAGRAVELARRSPFAGGFDVVTARAVATADKICREGRGMLAPHGRFILYKTPGQADEVTALRGDRGLRWRATPEFDLPGGAGTRLFLVGERG